MGSSVLTPRFLVYRGPPFPTYAAYVVTLLEPYWPVRSYNFPLVCLSRSHYSDPLRRMLEDSTGSKYRQSLTRMDASRVVFTDADYSFSWLVSV